jgi:nitrogen regulatory protein PII
VVFRKIEAHVRRERVEAVRQALLRVGVPAMDTVEVLGLGRQTGIKLAGRHGVYTVDTSPAFV